MESPPTASTGTIDVAIICFSIVAAFLAISLLLVQTDAVARLIFSPVRLKAKRRQEQLHTLQLIIGDVIQRIRTHINEGQVFEAELERKVTQFIQRGDDEELKDLIDDILDGTGSAHPSLAPLIVGIAKDLTVCTTKKCMSGEGMMSNDSEEWYIHLAFPQTDGARQRDGISPRYSRRVQVPLLSFCSSLEQKFRELERNDYSMNTHKNDKGVGARLCFIADASSSFATSVLGDLLVKTKLLEAHEKDGDDNELISRQAFVQEPAWMFVLALLLRKKCITQKEACTILYALVKLEAYQFGCTSKIIGVTLPGQGCISLLLPLIAKVFPNERHIFAYSSHIPSVVERGVGMVEKKEAKNNSFSFATLPVTAMPRMVSVATPIVPLPSKRCKNLSRHLAELPYAFAGVIEAWMSSIDSLLLLKEDEASGYHPFLCNMDLLLKRDMVNGSVGLEHLSRFLRYISDGESKTTQDSQLLDAAQSILEDIVHQDTRTESVVSDSKILASIENCVSSQEINAVRKLVSLEA